MDKHLANALDHWLTTPPEQDADVYEDDITIEMITPAIAQRWLDKNTHNRNVRPIRVKNYAADMASGAWEFNGDPIRFSDEGTLLDGQHRLEAIVASGVAIRMVVIRGLAHQAQNTMDGAITRTFGDVLALQGEHSVHSLASAVRSVRLWENGTRAFTGNSVTSNPVLLDTLHRHPWIREALPLLIKVSKIAHIPTSVSAALYMEFYRLDKADATWFFEMVSCQENLEIPQPIFKLRNTIEANRRNVRGTQNRTYVAAITIKAWNAYRAGTQIQSLGWRPGGANPEKFPTAQ